jgi:hypothetical protein
MGNQMARTVQIPSMSITQVVAVIEAWVIRIVTLGLILIFAMSIANEYGFRVSIIPTMSSTQLLYMADAWALLTGRIKLG